MRWLALALLLFAASAPADEIVSICFNYGCLAKADARYSDVQLRRVRDLLADSRNAAHERELLGVAIGWMLGWAGQQTPIAADRGGNYADDAAYGRMDCIDHSTTTTRLLRLLEQHGWLRFHRVLDPALRTTLLVFEHYSAQIEEIVPAGDDAGRYVVDSWFFDNGQPAVVMPLKDWLAGEGPDAEY